MKGWWGPRWLLPSRCRSHSEQGISFWLGCCYCGEFWLQGWDGAKTEVVVGEDGVKGNEEHGEIRAKKKFGVFPRN